MKDKKAVIIGVLVLGLLLLFQPGAVLAGGPLAGNLIQGPAGLRVQGQTSGVFQLPADADAQNATGPTGMQDSMMIPDHTLVERWVLGAPDPGGELPYGWFDVIGENVFNTFRTEVTWTGSDVVIKLFTNFPEAGYGNGNDIGYTNGSYYQPADLFFDLDFDGVWDTGIALIDHGAIPADPSSPDPPGYGEPADNFVKGGVYSTTAWFTSDDIHYYHSGRGGRYDISDPKEPPVWMRLGTKIGDAQITWTRLEGSDPDYEVDIVLKDVNGCGQWDHFVMLWGTANCANDVIVASTEVVPEIVANYVDGPLDVSSNTPVSVAISLYPGRYQGVDAAWWVLTRTPYDPPVKWYSYMSGGGGWLSGFYPYLIAPLEVLSPLEVLNSTLTPGTFTFYFGVVPRLNGVPHGLYLDSVTVNVSDSSTP